MRIHPPHSQRLCSRYGYGAIASRLLVLAAVFLLLLGILFWWLQMRPRQQVNEPAIIVVAKAEPKHVTQAPKAAEPRAPEYVPGELPSMPPPPEDFVPNLRLEDPGFRAELLKGMKERRRTEFLSFHKGWLKEQKLSIEQEVHLVEDILDYEMVHAEKMMPIRRNGAAFPTPPSLKELGQDRQNLLQRLEQSYGSEVSANYEKSFPGPSGQEDEPVNPLRR